MTSSNVKQLSKQWFDIRLGKFTASQAYRLMDSKKREEYIKLIASERLFGAQPKKNSFAMLWGHKYEPLARAVFEQETGLKIRQVGFYESTDPELAGWFGASPDGVEEANTFGVEIKCLAKPKHHNIIRSGRIPIEYYWQVCGQMLATRIPLWYFVTYNPTTYPNIYYLSYSWSDVSGDIENLKKSITSAIAEVKKIMYNWRKE